MITWYCVKLYWEAPKAFEVVKETKCQITYIQEWHGRKNESRVAKYSKYEQWFHSFQEAKQHIIDRERKKLIHAQKKVVEFSESHARAMQLEESK